VAPAHVPASRTTTTISAAAPSSASLAFPAGAPGDGAEARGAVGLPQGPQRTPEAGDTSPSTTRGSDAVPGDPAARPPAVRRLAAHERPAGQLDAGPVRRVSLRVRSGRQIAASSPPAVEPELGSPPPLDHAPTASDAAGAAVAQTTAPLPAAPRAAGRPEPTRAATLAAYRNALPAVPSPSAAVAAPAIAPVLAVARWPSPPPMTRPATLARVEGSGPVAQNGDAPAAAKPESPDLDALADHVLERLRHELRDGRERLGYLLDDLR
jgi:hypothetical protein